LIIRPLQLGMAIQHWLFNRNPQGQIMTSQSLNTNAMALKNFK